MMHTSLSLLSILLASSSVLALPSTPTTTAAFEPLPSQRPASRVVRSLLSARLRRSPARIQEQVAVLAPKAQLARTVPVKRSAPVVINPKAKRSIEKRAANAPDVVPNPKSKRAVVSKRSPPVAVVVNPKAKRALVERSVPVSPIVNPKTRRSTVTLSEPIVEKRRRNILDFLADMTFARNRLRRSVALAPRADDAFVEQPPKIGIVLAVPNPKSPNFLPVASSIAAGPDPTSTTSSAPTTTTQQTTTAPTTTQTTTTTTTTLRTTTTSVAPSSTASAWPKSGPFVAAAYYPGWSSWTLPPSKIDYSKLDLIDFAFALPQSDCSLAWDDSSTGSTLNQVVKYAHAAGTKVAISIGGWTDSTYFSRCVQSGNRAKFIDNIVALQGIHKVDGIDIDWEYPGGGGDSGNLRSSSDTANFLVFLQALKQALPDGIKISSCTTHRPFIGANGSPITDVAAFAEVLDHILVMNYDVWGASSNPGPNAPLSNACPNSYQPNANMESAISIWENAGMPRSKILMGVPGYGYISSSSATTLVNKRGLDGSLRARGMANRERAAVVHQETQKSYGHILWEQAQADRKVREKKRALERRKVAQEFKKRGTIIVCPNNHSGKPCAGITDQGEANIAPWNPLNITKNANGTVTVNPSNGTDGVFPGSGVGIGKLGNGNLADISGNQIQFYQLISYGVLVRSGTSNVFTPVNGYTRKWDECSSTPFLYDTKRRIVITYDDPQSLILKGQMAKSKGIMGVNMWDLSGDTDRWDLVSAYRAGMGLS